MKRQPRKVIRFGARLIIDIPIPVSKNMSFKFDDDGVVKEFHGNTIICHIPQQTEFFNKLLDFYRFAKRLSFYDKITLLPPSSYHVTIMNCCHEHDRSEGHWPKGIDPDTSMLRCTSHLTNILTSENAATAGSADFELELQVYKPAMSMQLDKPRSINVVMEPSTDSQETRIKQFRDKVSSLTGLIDPSHDSIRFHITLAYINEELTIAETQELTKNINQLHKSLAEACPIIKLAAPEFVTFDDMFYFHTVAKLSM